jgi:hypothetical protein
MRAGGAAGEIPSPAGDGDGGGAAVGDAASVGDGMVHAHGESHGLFFGDCAVQCVPAAEDEGISREFCVCGRASGQGMERTGVSGGRAHEGWGSGKISRRNWIAGNEIECAGGAGADRWIVGIGAGAARESVVEAKAGETRSGESDDWGAGEVRGGEGCGGDCEGAGEKGEGVVKGSGEWTTT